MERRRAATEAIAANIRAAAASISMTIPFVSQATGVITSAIDGSSNEELSLEELVTAGGLFRVPPGDFLAGANQ